MIRTCSKRRGGFSIAGQPDNRTAAHITYEITAIGPAGDTFMEEFTANWYEGFMLEWEKAMNHYLDTGDKIA